MRSSNLTLERVKSVLHYDPDTGQFTRLMSLGRWKAGPLVGWIESTGYHRTVLDGERVYLHRVAVFYMTGHWPPEHVDHINGDKLDNRWVNLREATASQNIMNSKIAVTNSSGVRGVHYYKQTRKWSAYLAENKKLGYFDTKEEAAAARAEAELRVYREFSPLASPGDTIRGYKITKPSFQTGDDTRGQNGDD